MRLQRVRLIRFRQFIEQELQVDPNVTVIVGRNDSGKTGFLRQFFSQPFYEGVLSSADRPLIQAARNHRIEFAMRWRVEAEDHERVRTAFGVAGKRIDLTFRDETGPAKRWQYAVDAVHVEAYSGVGANRQPILREELEPRRIFPAPLYLNITTSLTTMFEARLLDAGNDSPAPTRPFASSHEGSLLRLAGLGGETRAIQGTWTEWEPSLFPRRHVTLDEIEQRLAILSMRITAKLRMWWTDPPDTTFRLRLAGGDDGKKKNHARNSYTFVSSVTDKAGFPLQGSGLHWFLTLLVNLELLEEHPHPLLLLFDEPAAPLHPSAQRMVARLLDSLSSRWQVIYSTHSPFMVDWNFPQRIRVFTRESDTRTTIIQNRPYAGGRQVWDPLRESIGVTVGDVATVGEKNIFVEGISDQVILANVSEALKSVGGPSLDLAETSIIPYGEDPVLRQMLSLVRAARARAVVLVDKDASGKKASRIAEKDRVPVVEAAGDRQGTEEGSIEDVVGLDQVLEAVNEVYAEIEGVRPLTPEEVRANRGTLSLGTFLEAYFDQRFEKAFSKVSVSVALAQAFRENPSSVGPGLRSLIQKLAEALAAPPLSG